MKSSKDETLEMQRLEDGTIRLLAYDGEVAAEFEPVPHSDIVFPRNHLMAVEWAKANGFKVDESSHWSMQKYNEGIDQVWSELANQFS